VDEANLGSQAGNCKERRRHDSDYRAKPTTSAVARRMTSKVNGV
jgi:hypothetical protein